MKKRYTPPKMEVYEYKPEKGYAVSQSLDPSTDLIMDVSDSLENVTEGNNYSLYGDDNWY